MASTPPIEAPAGVLDANVVIAICCREVQKYAPALDAVTQLHETGWTLHAPHVLVSEVLYVLCGKRQNGDLTPAQHAAALATFNAYLHGIHFPDPGDAALALRAEELRGGYGCSHSADGLYLALTEWLTRTAVAELITFDTGLQRQAAVTAPHLTIRLLTT